MTATAAGEIIYEVEARLDPSIVGEYDAWLPGHVREVIACPGFTGAEMQLPVGEGPPGEILRRTQFRIESMAALERYLEQDAPRLRADGAARFGDRAVLSRRLFTPSGVPLPLPEEPVTCRNCGGTVPGKFCADCGQSRDIHVLSMHEVVGDVTHSLLHLDSRAWRTLKALVLRPGLLTNEFIAGRHQRYLPPFRLYLVVSILFFTLSALLPDAGFVYTEERDVTGATITTGPRDTGGIADAGACDFDLAGSGLAGFEPSLERVCGKVQADGGKRLGEVFLATAPKLMFVFLPLVAATAMIFYWRPRRLYAEHVVTFLHSHALLFLVLTAGALFEAVSVAGPAFLGWLEAVGGLLLLYVPWYVYRAMRVVYGEGAVRTAAKFVAMSLLYFVLLGLTFAAGMVYSALSL